MMNDFAQYFPIWDKLTSEQQNRIFSVNTKYLSAGDKLNVLLFSIVVAEGISKL